ncbi:MAG: hypothetical protein EOR73_28555 [Mesorhizobium sp.]|nr:MAG: hypothetical protein EOR73_28555 [Mesorhizobium sp.]
MHGLTEETLSSAHPDIKLEYANRHVDAPEPESESVVELNTLQKKYLGDRALSEMTDSDRENLEWLGTLNPAIEKPAESAKPEAPAEVANPLEDAPVIVDAQSVLDPELIKDLSPVRRAGLADALQTVRRGSRIGDSISQQTSLQQAKFHLAPYVKRKR